MKTRALLVASVATVLVFVWLAATVHFNYEGNWTGLYCTGATLPVPPELDAGTLRSVHPIGYDGQMYRYIAHDPFFQCGYAKYVDDARLRYRRILVPLLAYFLAGGRQSLIDYTFVAVVLASIFAGCFWCSQYFVLRGKSEWWGLLFVIVPATITSFDRMLVDGTVTALFAGFLVYAERRNWRGLFVVCLLASFTRETGVLLVVSVFLSALIARDIKRILLFGSATLPILLWSICVWNHTPISTAYRLATWPLVGHFQRFLIFREVAEPWKQAVLRTTDLISLIGLLICLGLAAYLIIPERVREIQICVGLFVGVGLVLGAPDYLSEPYGFARPISPLLLFLMLRGTVWAPLLLTIGVAINLVNQFTGVAKGLLR